MREVVSDSTVADLASADDRPTTSTGSEKMKNLFRRSLLLSAMLLMGCQPHVTSSPPIFVTTSPATEAPYRIDSTLTVSPAPLSGHTAEVTFSVNVVKLDDATHPRSGLARSRAWIDFFWTNADGSFSEAYSSAQVAADQVLVSGELPWQGSYDGPLALHGTVRLPREGVWSIRGRFIGEGWSYGAGAEADFAVIDGNAVLMGTEEFEKGPYAYLANYAYHRSGVVGPRALPDPIAVGLDLSKAPHPGDEVTLSCTIRSVIDVQDVSIGWSFGLRTAGAGKDIPASELLSSADLAWKSDVKKDTPVVFSTTIAFPIEGEWQIAAIAKAGTKIFTGSGHIIPLTITPAMSYFGWLEEASASQPTVPRTGKIATARP